MAFSVLGHHAGLPSVSHARGQIWGSTLEPIKVSEALAGRLGADREGGPWPDAVAEFLRDRRGLEATFDQEILIRMLFSCLVDADYLDTETYMTGRERTLSPFVANELFQLLDGHVRKLAEGSEPTPVNAARREIYQACLSAAGRPPGCFRITAPTGSGKTLAMLAFALKHAERNGLRRVIVVLPFLAIIEQNARVYREALQSLDDAGVLIEHHSAVMVSGDDGSEPTENESQDRTRAKQATENWDAPVVVTTAVQFLESLFSRRPASCRKLHNIARSVVVFDEVQTLPFPLLDPILRLYGHFATCSAFRSCSARPRSRICDARPTFPAALLLMGPNVMKSSPNSAGPSPFSAASHSNCLASPSRLGRGMTW